MPPVAMKIKIPDPRGRGNRKKYSIEETLGMERNEYIQLLRDAQHAVSRTLDTLGEVTWGELISKHPELETDYENSWIAEVLIMNVIVNARGNRGKRRVGRAKTNPTSDETHVGGGSDNPEVIDHNDGENTRDSEHEGNASHEQEDSDRSSIPTLANGRPNKPAALRNTCTSAAAPKTAVAPKKTIPSNARGNNRIQFQLTDSEEEPPNPVQVTRKRTAVKVVMIGPNPKSKKSRIDNSSCDAIEEGASGMARSKGKGRAMPTPRGSKI
ncbi:uncharacterized protein EI90DRAFT_3255849 [Cantharellus anzutake]|uniref:uncharacterized protein n=1 Tax=Cantharellus anzutake TaxID=1750568 RepID=UPI001905B4D9|nr:uncharacterized protein EI90DRAFT_3255849 [Cantharellus anzutake]KAF8337501.1 hypothetical protein EI90DRAFT_3255849 [Cantharellus anzutake]